MTVILGVDPGLSVSGFGILSCDDKRKVSVIDCGALIMSSTKHDLPARVKIFFDFYNDKIEQHAVKHLALETPFLGKNAQNFLKLGYLRGVLMLLSQQHNLSLAEFAPREIKAAVTGYGHADKEQVARVMLRLFPQLAQPRYLDTTDALAIALCGVWKKL